MKTKSMKSLFKILLAMALLATPTWAQIAGDTTKSQKQILADTSAAQAEKKTPADTSVAKTTGAQRSQAGFRDENGNGVDDRLEMRGKGMGRGRDKFIDADGDGICDGREAGLGFHHGQGGSIKLGEGKGGHGRKNQSRGGK